jgi:hypothetical protein
MSFVGIISPVREFQTLPLSCLLLCSSPCLPSALFHQIVSFRRLSFHLSFSTHSFHQAVSFDASLAIPAALIITLSFVGILSLEREFQTLPLPFLLLSSSPCPHRHSSTRR